MNEHQCRCIDTDFTDRWPEPDVLTVEMPEALKANVYLNDVLCLDCLVVRHGHWAIEIASLGQGRSGEHPCPHLQDGPLPRRGNAYVVKGLCQGFCVKLTEGPYEVRYS